VVRPPILQVVLLKPKVLRALATALSRTRSTNNAFTTLHRLTGLTMFVVTLKNRPLENHGQPMNGHQK